MTDDPRAPRLRDLHETDLAWMAEVERELFGPSAWSESLIREDFRYGARRYRGVWLGEERVAYAVYGFDGDAFSLMNLAVVPAHRREGIARLVLEDLLDEARSLDVAEVWLEVAVDNLGALALYRSFGFEDVRIRKRYYQPEGIDALVMRRPMRRAAGF
ncbi:ribosomal protein S18-alanine N-acetyltransferase [Demequina zhanjiangensis]|uniref:Ribosomal protein S18-alanine N-acetyltransferase n=1 Tax=Demequina zhanjiangensis TaxID=3051659 RepID=A0ABT8FXC5_9MICO|nr:ribosomal protein S18-alanine N-acetyltransferase [Demequina sp. SYSU T00b26]MDN4471551.1 ribosomal protein S18-alanine N-acetyltransferase [Demequina sp. SYSU T00b26]